MAVGWASSRWAVVSHGSAPPLDLPLSFPFSSSAVEEVPLLPPEVHATRTLGVTVHHLLRVLHSHPPYWAVSTASSFRPGLCLSTQTRRDILHQLPLTLAPFWLSFLHSQSVKTRTISLSSPTFSHSLFSLPAPSHISHLPGFLLATPSSTLLLTGPQSRRSPL